jgi:flagellar P-ring protein precursor FlgI
MTRPLARVLVLAVLAASLASAARAQTVRIKDLVTVERDVPVRLMGYGLVVGLDGTGDRAVGGRGSPQTVRSITNLLRRFGVQIPAELLRTRNVAAVLVTAEVSPYLRPGGRFDVAVASMGDAVSLRGGQLYSTPLLSRPDAPPVATAQGGVVISDGVAVRGEYRVETAGGIPSGGLLQVEMATPAMDGPTRLLLRSPDLGTAVKVADAVNAALGAETATVEDPGSVQLEPPADVAMPVFLGQVGDLAVEPERVSRVVIDARDGTVVAGSGLTVGEAVVSHGALTLAIGGTVEDGTPGSVRVPAGTSVQDVAIALHAVAATPSAIAAIFRSLKEVGAIHGEVVVR